MVYSKNIYEMIENSLKTNLSELVNIDSYADLNNINFAHVRINFSETNGRRDAMLCFNMHSSTEYLKIFKTYPICKFLVNDYRKDTKTADGKLPYFSVKFDYNTKPVIALLREITDELETYGKYDSVVFGDRHFSVLKITEDNGTWMSFDGYKVVDISNENTPGDIYLDRLFEEKKKSTEDFIENTLL